MTEFLCYFWIQENQKTEFLQKTKTVEHLIWKYKNKSALVVLNK